MEVTNVERVTVEEGRKSVRVCDWGSKPFTKVERKNGTFAWVPNGFKCITKEAGVQLVAETRVDEQGGTALYRFSAYLRPEKIGEWRPNPTAALDSVQALLKNTKHRVGANGNVVLGVTYDNLQRRIIGMNGLDATGTAVGQLPQYHQSKSQPPPAAARSSRSRTCKQKKSKKRSISQAILPSVEEKEMTTEAADEQQKMDVEDGCNLSLFLDLEDENKCNGDSPSKRMRGLSIDDDDDDKMITMNEDDFPSLPEFDFPIDQGLDSSTFDVTAADEDKNDGLSEGELDLLETFSDADIDALHCDLKLTPVSRAMLDQVEEPNKPQDEAKDKEGEEEEFFPEEKKKESSTLELIDNTWAFDWTEDEEILFLPADKIWIGPE